MLLYMMFVILYKQNYSSHRIVIMESLIGIFFVLLVILLTIISLGVVFAKAGYPGWVAFIPILNIVFALKVGGCSPWLTLLMFIPLINVLVAYDMSSSIAAAFGKGPGFGFGLWLFPFIFYPILAFGNAEYNN